MAMVCDRSPVPQARPQDTGGFILVAVLWILGGLATLAAIYAVYVVNAATGMTVDEDRLQVEASMSGALELTAYYLNAVEPAARPGNGAFNFQLGGKRVAVSFVSEAAKIDLNAASKAVLAGLFKVLGAQPEAADEFADRIIGWRSPSEREIESFDKEITAYRTAGLGYDPRQAPFASVQELWLVLGLPPDLVERAMPFLTVFSGVSGVDVMDAAPEIVAALPGMTPVRLDNVLNLRTVRPVDAAAMLSALGPAQTGAAVQASAAIRVRIAVELPRGHRANGEAVILLLGDAPDPYRVLYWSDGFDG